MRTFHTTGVEKMNTIILTLTSSLVISAMSFATQANVENKTDVKFGGYIKIDSMWSDFSAGTISGNSIGRDFYVASTVAVSETDVSDDAVFDMNARQSRFNMATTTQLASGKIIRSKIELDFVVSPGGNERVSNSYAPRIRHAFITYDGWLFGQTWSNFQNVAALPETMDFVGPAEGTVFVRQAQLRYSTGGWSFAIENPESTITVNGARLETDDAVMPDVSVKYTHQAEWGIGI